MESPFDASTEQMLTETIRKHAVPMGVRSTGVDPVLTKLKGIRVVLFDVYGTLLISGSGDVGTTDVDSRPAAFSDALEAIGIDYKGENEEGVARLGETIREHHARSRAREIEFPEVEIRNVWQEVLAGLADAGRIAPGARDADATRLALEYEMRTNPVWPMPNCLETLRALSTGGLQLGIVSNAQVFTRLLFPALLGASLAEIGFDPELCAWSYVSGQAKPGTFLYEQVNDRLAERGIAAHGVLYVGNDMLKDVWPASRVRFHTALFAGDARSYRPRSDDERVGTVTPDLVLTNLAQLPECVLTTGFR